MIFLEYQNIKIFLQKVTLQIYLKKFLLLKKLQKLYHRLWEEIVGYFYEKELQKTNQEELWIEKLIKKQGD